MNPTQILDYSKSTFSAPTSAGFQITHDVYTRGQGKIVVIIQELPGIGQETLALADRFVTRGYQVVLPHLFGPLGKTSPGGNLVRVCISKEFYMFASKRTSPIVDWLRALCQRVKDHNEVDGVAVIGMCLTGTFAISLMADDAVLAGFASQPSLPLFKSKGVHMSDKDIEAIKGKLDQAGPMHAGRFKGDIFCTAKRFKTFAKTFNDDKKRIHLHELDPSKKFDHSILTLHYDDDNAHPTKKTLGEVMDYFDGVLS